MFINIIWLPIISILSILFGFMFRSRQIKKSRRRIISLENEMLTSHAEILKLQQELAALRKENLPTYKSRVVPMNELPPEENQESKDAAHRKKFGK